MRDLIYAGLCDEQIMALAGLRLRIQRGEVNEQTHESGWWWWLRLLWLCGEGRG